jgi:hypothetical protein
VYVPAQKAPARAPQGVDGRALPVPSPPARESHREHQIVVVPLAPGLVRVVDRGYADLFGKLGGSDRGSRGTAPFGHLGLPRSHHEGPSIP